MTPTPPGNRIQLCQNLRSGALVALSDQDKKLLADIFSASVNSPSGLNPSRFRADNEQFIPDLDQLERNAYLQRTDNVYSISLLTLIHLAKQNPAAQSLLEKCGLVFSALKSSYKDNLGKMTAVSEIAGKISLSEDDIGMALKFVVQAPIGLGYASNAAHKIESVSPSERILQYKSFEEVVRDQEDLEKRRDKQNSETRILAHIEPEYQIGPTLSATSSETNWEAIKREFNVTKVSFGKNINFIKDPFKRNIIFRDVEEAYALASAGFYKPAVILAGGVIEELLRLYLEQKGIRPQKPLKTDFNGYIQTCIQKRLLKDSVSHLSDSVRGFRNLVHLSAEETKKHTISKATAIGAVSSIFTIANDF